MVKDAPTNNPSGMINLQKEQSKSKDSNNSTIRHKITKVTTCNVNNRLKENIDKIDSKFTMSHLKALLCNKVADKIFEFTDENASTNLYCKQAKNDIILTLISPDIQWLSFSLVVHNLLWNL